MVINTKGPSASGKSTLRPLQKKLAGDIGVRWSDFALISPDIWRKQLLDYGTLGPAYKYAGAFTAEELQIVDQKLDRYMAAQTPARRHDAPVDRPVSFRQLRPRFGRGGQQSVDPFRPGGLFVLHDHSARHAGRTGVEARTRIRPLQGRGRYAGARRGGVHGDSRCVLHLGPPHRQAHSIRVSGQHRAPRRTPAHGGLRRQRYLQHSQRQGNAGHRALRPRQRRRRGRGFSLRGSTGCSIRGTTRASCGAASADFAGSISPSRRPGGSICASNPERRRGWMQPCCRRRSRIPTP